MLALYIIIVLKFTEPEAEVKLQLNLHQSRHNIIVLSTRVGQRGYRLRACPVHVFLLRLLTYLLTHHRPSKVKVIFICCKLLTVFIGSNKDMYKIVPGTFK